MAMLDYPVLWGEVLELSVSSMVVLGYLVT